MQETFETHLSTFITSLWPIRRLKNYKSKMALLMGLPTTTSYRIQYCWGFLSLLCPSPCSLILSFSKAVFELRAVSIFNEFVRVWYVENLAKKIRRPKIVCCVKISLVKPRNGSKHEMIAYQWFFYGYLIACQYVVERDYGWFYCPKV